MLTMKSGDVEAGTILWMPLITTITRISNSQNNEDDCTDDDDDVINDDDHDDSDGGQDPDGR